MCDKTNWLYITQLKPWEFNITIIKTSRKILTQGLHFNTELNPLLVFITILFDRSDGLYKWADEQKVHSIEAGSSDHCVT